MNAAIFKRVSQEDVAAAEESLIAQTLRLTRRLDSVEKASFLALMAAMADDGADIRDALEIGNRVLTDAGRAPLWFLKDFAPASDTKEGDSMSKKKVMDADKLEILNIRLHCACALLDVVQGAVAENRTGRPLLRAGDLPAYPAGFGDGV